ncbi:MAG: 4-alpha-glucanotransferase [Balneolaceae bacterium]
MRFSRSCGTLVHPTSFPAKYGMGDLGYEAKEFINFLAETGQGIWQVLPLGPTGYGNSPYASYSAFAGNHYLISLDLLVEKGLLNNEEAATAELPVTVKADYETSYGLKDQLYKKAFHRFNNQVDTETEKKLSTFRKDNEYWLEDYCLFSACSLANDRKPWNKWEQKGLVQRKPKAIREAKRSFSDEIEYQTWLQFEFFEQWYSLKEYATSKNIKVMGDIPIFVDHNSADVWGNPEFFEVDKNGYRTLVSGVPPDYFSETGQLWGNPLYNWDSLEKDNFKWWVERFRQMFELFDSIRVDHFRGFDEFWQVGASEKTAENGTWEKAPGYKLFNTIKKELGELPIIAEDLGVMTPGVIEMRDAFNFPGMKILQFAFDSDETNDFLPHNYPQNCVTYSGTHDNDTSIGWYNSAPDVEKHRVREYAKSDGKEVQWDLIRLGMLSVADQAIFPLQDFMNLDGSHRMNTPGTVGENWMWRFTPDMLHHIDKDRIRKLAKMGNRLNKGG